MFVFVYIYTRIYMNQRAVQLVSPLTPLRIGPWIPRAGCYRKYEGHAAIERCSLYTHLYLHIHIPIYTCAHIHIHAHNHIYIYVCIYYIYKYTQTHTPAYPTVPGRQWETQGFSVPIVPEARNCEGGKSVCKGEFGMPCLGFLQNKGSREGSSNI